MARVLFTRAKWDLPTAYLAAYGQLLIDFAIEQGHQIVDLLGDNATSENFEAEMAKQPDIVIIQGHGQTNLVTGQNNEPLIQAGVNDNLMMNKISFLYSCLTGVTLGPAMVAKGCPEYHGYLSDLTFIYHPPSYERGQLLEDPWAQPFFDSANVTGYSVLLGQNPKDVYEKTVERYNYWWDWWLGQNDPIADDIMTWLNWDRHNFITITPEGIYRKEPIKLSISAMTLPLVAAASLFFLIASDKSKEK